MVARCPGSHCRALANNTNRGLVLSPEGWGVGAKCNGCGDHQPE